MAGDKIVIDPSNGEVTIARGGNIQITQDAEDDNKFTIGVSESPIFSAVYADNANIGGITVGSGGINMGGKKITGLADGSIAPGSTDAVTGGQLWNAYKRMTTSTKASTSSERTPLRSPACTRYSTTPTSRRRCPPRSAHTATSTR